MKKTVYLNDFRDAFHEMGRANQFSYEALEWLFDHCEELERDLGEDYELDVIALCCDFTQSTYEDINKDYRLELNDDNLHQGVIDYLGDNTLIVNYDDETVLFQQF
jgi:hypothetical protein